MESPLKQGQRFGRAPEKVARMSPEIEKVRVIGDAVFASGANSIDFGRLLQVI